MGTTTRRFSAAIELKAEDVKPNGWFRCYAAVFSNLDDNGDVIVPGAFTKTLDAAKSLLRRITGRQHAGDGDGELWPLNWQHDDKQRIGSILTARKDDHGLLVTGQIDFATEYGRATYDDMKAGALTGFSIGYRATKMRSGFLAELGKRVRKLFEIALEEVSVVWQPANVQAQLIEVKSLTGWHADDDDDDMVRVRPKALIQGALHLALRAYVQSDEAKQNVLMWEMKAAQMRRELGDAEIDRRAKARQESWALEVATMNEYKREVKAARANRQPLPPSPNTNPAGWQHWRQQKAWLDANGRR